MPEFDDTGSRILGILVEDGRRSFREVARRAGITTPTVQARVKRMMDEGLVRKISPIFDPSKFRHGLVFQLYLKVNPAEVEEVARKLEKRSEVRGIYLTTGVNNLTLRVAVDSLEALQTFNQTLDREYGVRQNSSQMIVRIFKDDQAVMLRPGMGIHLKCETCNGPIPAKPFVLKVSGHERFFCCPMCLEKFRENYEPKLR
jgi:DNA-binding Lrp family transcriptional regulator